MSYEIPQALKYEEKIIFGLNARQLSYLGIAGLLVLLLIKTGLPLFLKILLCLISSIFGTALAFLKLDKKLMTRFKYCRSKQHLGYFHKELAQLIEIKNIANKTILLQDNTLLGIIQVTPTNFTIKSAQDKKAIILRYQRFLNSLDFPIQILVRTVNANLDNYINHLKWSVKKRVEKKKNQGLENLFKDYVKFIEKYISENAVKNKVFYVIIHGGKIRKNEQENQQTRLELDNRIIMCRNNLSACGLETFQLNTDELINLITSFFGCTVQLDMKYTSPLTIFHKRGGK
jgi:hypothetical protein